MHKKLEADLVSLAHSILQMKNKDDVNALHKKAHDIYEKLSVLKFVEDYVSTTPNLKQSKEEIITGIEEVLVQENEKSTVISFDEPVDEVIASKEEINEEIEEVKDETPAEVIEFSLASDVEESTNELKDVIEPSENDLESEALKTAPVKKNLAEEFKDAISADVATELFESATKENPVVEPVVTKQRSLNDALFTDNIQVGLNDRIAFVKHLFDGSQEDFNRVLSQLNSFKSESEAKNFIDQFVKPDYDWSEKEEFESRLIDLIDRKFL